MKDEENELSYPELPPQSETSWEYCHDSYS